MPKFYAVKKGKTPGIYNSWPECQKQTIGFSGAVFKSFGTKKEAEEFISKGQQNDEKKEYALHVYTDGSAMNNAAGGAAVILEEKTVIFTRPPGEQTNNRGELTGILLAVQYTVLSGRESVMIYTDSQVSINVLSNGYTPSENLDLVNEIIEEMKGCQVGFTYVPAHTGILYNELADQYAKRATKLPLNRKVEQEEFTTK